MREYVSEPDERIDLRQFAGTCGFPLTGVVCHVNIRREFEKCKPRYETR